MALTNGKLLRLHGKQTLNLEERLDSDREQFTGSESFDAI